MAFVAKMPEIRKNQNKSAEKSKIKVPKNPK